MKERLTLDRRVIIKAVNYNLDDLPTLRQKKKKLFTKLYP